MKRLIILSCLALIFLPNSNCNAQLIIDDFSRTGNGEMVGGDISGVFIDVSGASPFTGGYNFVGTLMPPTHFEYDLGSGRTLGSIAPNNTATLDIPISVTSNFPDWTMRILFTDSLGVTDIAYMGEVIDFFNDALRTTPTVSLADANKIRFEYSFSAFAATSGGTFGGAAGSFVANPEPTSALMFGTVLLGTLIRRRKP